VIGACRISANSEGWHSSCTVCRRRKVRCNRETPCNNCIRSKTEICVYDNPVAQPVRQQSGQGAKLSRPIEPREPQSTAPAGQVSHFGGSSSVAPSNTPLSLANGSTQSSSFTSETSSLNVESLKARIRQLEEELSGSNQTSTNFRAGLWDSSSNADTSNSSNKGAGLILENGLFGQAHFVSRSILHKSRLFGQSHWVHGFAPVSPHKSGHCHALININTRPRFLFPEVPF
jgi:hypothetical protein